MGEWNEKELEKIAKADDFYISPFREDGTTYGTPTWIWSVVVDQGVYVRAYNGQNSSWYQAAIREKAGKITVAGFQKDVTFEPIDDPTYKDLNDRIDEAYRSKYKKSPYLRLQLNDRVRSATIKVSPK